MEKVQLGEVWAPSEKMQANRVEQQHEVRSWCHGSRSCCGNGSDVGENAGECLDDGKLIVAQIFKRGWGGMQESLDKCAGVSVGGACGAAGWDGAIVREKLDSFGDTFGAGPQNVDAVTSVVIRGGSKIPTVDTVGSPGETVAGCFIDNNAGAGGC